MWTSGIFLVLKRLVLGYCIFVLVLVWMLNRAKRVRKTPRAQEQAGADREPPTHTNRP